MNDGISGNSTESGVGIFLIRNFWNLLRKIVIVLSTKNLPSWVFLQSVWRKWRQSDVMHQISKKFIRNSTNNSLNFEWSVWHLYPIQNQMRFEWVVFLLCKHSSYFEAGSKFLADKIYYNVSPENPKITKSLNFSNSWSL